MAEITSGSGFNPNSPNYLRRAFLMVLEADIDLWKWSERVY